MPVPLPGGGVSFAGYPQVVAPILLLSLLPFSPFSYYFSQGCQRRIWIDPLLNKKIQFCLILGKLSNFTPYLLLQFLRHFNPNF